MAGALSIFDGFVVTKQELYLDYWTYKLWKEFWSNQPLSKEIVEIIQDEIGSKKGQFNEDIRKKVFCTRFFCGLSEANMQVEGSTKCQPLKFKCLAHLKKIFCLYPFSSAEKGHMYSHLKMQFVLSAYRAGNVEQAQKKFHIVYETELEDEEYQEELIELFQTDNDATKNDILQKFSFKKCLRETSILLKPIMDQYDVPFLIQAEAHLEDLKKKGVNLWFLKAFHTLVSEEDIDECWASITKQTHSEVAALREKHTSRCSKNSPTKVHDVETRMLIAGQKALGNTLSKENEVRGRQSAESSERMENFKQTKKSETEKTNPFKLKWMDAQKDAETIEWSSDESYSEPVIQRCLSIIVPTSTKRRKPNPWTVQELNWLEEGVKTFGKGKWAPILERYPFQSCRTSVDLKDKWRNHTGYKC